jgi:transcription elongation factor GreA
MKIPFTQSGFDALKVELEKKKSERPAIVKELQRARELGDLSENGLYKATKGKLIDTDRRIRQLTHLIKNAHVDDSTNIATVGIGNTVTLLSDGKEYVYQIVGTYESDPSNGKISIVSPLGKLLMDKKVGDEVALKRDREIRYKIVKIN